MRTIDIVENHAGAADDARGHEWLRWAIALWLAFGCALVVKAAVEPVKHSVYPCFELAARGWSAEENIYEIARGYRYSPAFAMSFNAFAAFPARLGGMAWQLLNVSALFAGLWLLVRDVLPGRWDDRARAAFLALALIGSARGLWAGQTTSLCFAFAAFAAWGIVHKRWWLAAMCLAIPVYIKVWPIAFALLAMACWPRRLIGRFVLCALLPAAMPFLSKPPHVVVWQYANWAEFLCGPCLGRLGTYRDFWTILAAFRVPPSPRVYTVLQLATAAGVAAWCVARRLKGETDRGLLAFTLAAWAAWQLSFGPATERNTYGLAAPMLAWAVVSSFREDRLRWTAAAAWGCNAVLGGTGAFERLFDRAVPQAEALAPAGVLLLLAWLAARPCDRRASAIDSKPEAKAGTRGCDEATRIWRHEEQDDRATAAA
ncbi:MAG: glycosyltransferase family 87 protein [Planctomycetaceae bacterium]